MAISIRVNHKDEQPQPFADRPSLDMAERMTSRDYTARHPLFEVIARARQLDGRSKNNYYNPRGDFQIARVGERWPARWIEDVDLAGELHTLGFDADRRIPRGPDALAVFHERLTKAFARCGIYE